MMVDLGAFSDENFDAKKWINNAVKARHSQDGLENHLVDLEMKLQLMSEEISANLEEQSSAAILRVPRATRDVIRIRDDAVSLRSSISSILSKLKQVAEFANVRKQLEVLEDRLDAMVQPRLTDALSNLAQEMRGILVQIGRFQSLEVYYTKFHLKSLKKIWDEFESRQRANRLGTEKNDMGRLANVNEFQSSHSALSFSTWLPSFYDDLLLYLEQEWKWCMIAFPDDYKTLVPKLLTEIMLAVNSSFVSHINRTTGDAVPETKAFAKGTLDLLSGDMPKGIKMHSKHLDAMIELHNLTSTFARNIQHLFSESKIQVLLDTMKAVYSPFETFKQKYGQMERAILAAEIGKLDLRGAVTRGVGAQGIELSETVRRMEESIPQVILLFEAAVERCINFTGGSEADELIVALDDKMLQYISMLNETLKSLRAVCGVDNASDSAKRDSGLDKKEGMQNPRKGDLLSNEEEWSMVQGALQILTVADCLTSRSSVFEASLRATLSRLSTSMPVSASGVDQNLSQLFIDDGNANVNLAGGAALDMAIVRLSKDPRFHALPHTSQRVAAFTETVNELVYDVLISKVRQRLSDVSRLPIWSSAEEISAFALPTFSAYPQSYVTSVGEYLLTLPQQLEPLAEGISSDDANADDAQFFATEWMFKVAEGASAIYTEQLRGIQYITDRGAQQLSVDIEYLANVLSALSVPIPPILATFQTCLSTPRDQLKDLIKSDSSTQLDLPTANLICKMRRVNVDQ
ncbi:Conserved oligomeric Golgi complex subunit 7 [Bienertia sinuspersici]